MTRQIRRFCAPGAPDPNAWTRAVLLDPGRDGDEGRVGALRLADVNLSSDLRHQTSLVTLPSVISAGGLPARALGIGFSDGEPKPIRLRGVTSTGKPEPRPRGLLARWKAWRSRRLLRNARIEEAFRQGQIENRRSAYPFVPPGGGNPG